jgi:hypothetical protein
MWEQFTQPETDIQFWSEEEKLGDFQPTPEVFAPGNLALYFSAFRMLGDLSGVTQIY